LLSVILESVILLCIILESGILLCVFLESGILLCVIYSTLCHFGNCHFAVSFWKVSFCRMWRHLRFSSMRRLRCHILLHFIQPLFFSLSSPILLFCCWLLSNPRKQYGGSIEERAKSLTLKPLTAVINLVLHCLSLSA